jgi:hypothetical protein
MFWDKTPCSPLKVNQVSEEHIASIFRVELSDQDTSARAGDKQEDSTLHDHCSENLKFYMKYTLISFSV